MQQAPRSAGPIALIQIAIAVPLLFWACGEGEPKPESRPFEFDLAREFARAEVQREVREIVFGTTSAHPHLVRGFGLDEETAGKVYLLSKGDRSSVEFFLAWPREIEMELDCQIQPASSGLQEMAVWLNDQTVGSLQLRPGRHRYKLRLPVENLHAGANRLQFRHGLAPGDVGSGPVQDASTALVWFGLRLGTGGSGDAVSPQVPRLRGTGDDPRVELPVGTRLDYHLRVPADASLMLASLASASGSGGQLDVTVGDAGGSERLIASFSSDDAGSGGGFRLPLFADAEAGAPVVALRLSLTARPRGSGEAAGSLLLKRPRIESATQQRVAGARPNVVIYVVDTLRRDHLGVYGYARPVSPHLDAFAEDAVVFDDAVAQSSWTRPTLVSLFTGLNPLRHGATDTPLSLSERATTLAEIFRSAGYDTQGFTVNPHMSAAFGVAQGFRGYEESENSRRTAPLIHTQHAGGSNPHAEQDLLHEQVLDWLQARDSEQPFLLFVHSMQPHAPYQPPERFWEALAPNVSRSDRVAYESIEKLDKGELSESVLQQLRSLYDAEIAANDESFGVLLDALKARGLYRDALILFLSDHGEAFHERDRLGHGSHLHAETGRIPLLVKPPGSGGDGRRVGDVVSQADVMPTLLEWIGLTPSEALDGISFAPLMRGGARGSSRPAIAHLRFGGSPLRTSVADGRWALIHTLRRAGRGESLELYDRVADPQETSNVADRHPDVVARLALLLARESARTPDWPLVEHDPEPAMLEQLEALGYLQ